MFKFARNFFIFFFITAIIPLFSMFLWTHYKMGEMEKERSSNFLDIGEKQLQKLVNQQLRSQENYILNKMQKITAEHNISDVFKDFIIQEQDYKQNKIYSYYESVYSQIPKIYLISMLPFKEKTLSFKRELDFNSIMPIGPYEIEVYFGDKINKSSLITTIVDPFIDEPHHHPMKLLENPDENFNGFPPPLPPPHLKPFDEGDGRPSGSLKLIKDNSAHKKISIYNNQNKVIATIILYIFKPKSLIPPISTFEREIGVLILSIGFIISILIGLYINNNFIKPLFLLSEASNKVQEGNLSFEIDANIKHEEIMNTFKSFNQMVIGLKEKNDLRTNFITSLTHDLKTPLIAQERSLELISDEFKERGLEDQYLLAKGIEKNNRHLLRMVNLILESYRFDVKNVNLKITPVKIKQLINNCFEKLSSLAVEKDIKLVNNIECDELFIEADVTSLTRVFMNLILNSIENSEQNGIIKINAELMENYINIIVEDNGLGIAKEDIEHIFDNYFTGKSDERKIGSGLGLYVCKKLIEAHNGKISVKSEVSKFTRFTVKLPVKLEI